jgi:hypothetical protein
MNLEDQMGDIISKARLMSGVSAAAAAQAAGVSEKELSHLETTQQLSPQINLTALATAQACGSEYLARNPRVYNRGRRHEC